jgi:hypothetical protein
MPKRQVLAGVEALPGVVVIFGRNQRSVFATLIQPIFWQPG